MLIETELLSEEFLGSPPPLLRLVSQAVPTSDFEELIGVHAVLDVRFRHGYVEVSLWPFLPVGQQKSCWRVSDCQHKTTRGDEVRVSEPLQSEHWSWLQDPVRCAETQKT